MILYLVNLKKAPDPFFISINKGAFDAVGKIEGAAGAVGVVVDDGYHHPFGGIGQMGQVEGGHVHTDPADDGQVIVAVTHTGKIRQATEQTIGVTKGDDADDAITLGDKGPAVAAGTPLFESFNLHHRGLDLQNGTQVIVTG